MDKKTSILQLQEFVAGYKQKKSTDYLLKNKGLVRQIKQTKKALKELSPEERAQIEDDLTEIFQALIIFEEKILISMEEINKEIQESRKQTNVCKAYNKASKLVKNKKDN